MIYKVIVASALAAPVTAKYYSSFSKVSASIANGKALGFWKNRGTQNIVTANAAGVEALVEYTVNSDVIQSYVGEFSIEKYSDANNLDPATATVKFANAVSLTADDAGDYVLFTDKQLFSATVNIGGSVGVYRGEYSSWSVQQIIYPPEQFKENSFFGAGIDYDQDSKVLAVTCLGCNYTTAKDGGSSGAIFLYEKKGPKDEFVNTAILTPSDNLDSQLFLDLSSGNSEDWGQSVQINGDNLIWQGVRGEKFPYLVFSKVAGKWKQVQTISQQSVLDDETKPWEARAQLYEDTIAIGSPTLGAVGGYVSVFGATTVDAKGKPVPKQWSVQQTLYPIALTPASDLFGSAVAIEKNTLAVADDASLFVYKRPSSEGTWSLQQVITAPLVKDIEIVGSTIATTDDDDFTTLYSENPRWDCLVVSVEDHFGDGWDGAKLRVDVPGGGSDFFYPRCDTLNPLQFRYCPSDRSDRGLYRFSIEGAKEARFFWELLWRVYDESSGDWYTGNWDTKIDFDWNSEDVKFEARKTTKTLSNNVTCQNCKTRPTSKPSAHMRALKGGDDKTHHPTISPAPTLETEPTSIWQILTLEATDFLFQDQHKSTSYYISDGKGRRLVSTGTLCPSASAGTECWEDLADGDYIVRLGGALNADDTATLKFCKMVNPVGVKTQVIIRVENDDCQVVAWASRNAFCTRNLHVYTLVHVELNLLGVSSVEGITAAGLTDVLAAAVPGTHSVKISSLVQSSGGVLATLVLSTDAGSSIDMSDADTFKSYAATVQSALSSGTYAMQRAAQAGAHASPLHSVSSIQLVDAHLVGTEEVPITLSAAPLVTATADAETESTDSKSSSSSAGFSTLAIAGFLVALVSVGLVVAVAIIPGRTPSASGVAHVPVADVESLEAPKKKVTTRALTPGDLRELVASEDAALKILENRAKF
jgi:hypothetical protein